MASGCQLVREVTVEGNQVAYSEPTKRDPKNEDRALVIGPPQMETPVPPSAGPSELAESTWSGFPVLVVGNKFVGTGRSALVELVEKSSVRFERVICSNNYCWHLIDEALLKASLPVGIATVRLTGRVGA